jgi:DsbC/DsbD-like thiol-disulfide interchange protein
LEKAIGLLNTPAEAGKAKALLERYTGKTMPTPAAWQTWFNQNKSNLYFSDSFDYKFYAGAAGPAPRAETVRATIDATNPGEPNDVAPVAAAATVTSYWHSKDTIYLKKGASAVLVVRLKIAPGWHTYASSSDKHVPYQMTKINVELPTGFRWNGDWQLPASKEGDVPGLAEYRDDVVFTREIYATVASPKIALKGTVQFQTCNAERCLPPDATPFEVTVTVQE